MLYLFALSRDGKSPIFASNQPGVHCIDLKTGELVHLAENLGLISRPVFGEDDKIYCTGRSLAGKTRSDFGKRQPAPAMAPAGWGRHSRANECLAKAAY